MSGDSALRPLRDLIAEVIAVDPQVLTESSGPHSVGAWTSRKHLELVVTLEEEFGIALSHQEIAGMSSVASVRSLLAGKGVAV
jgi:acyl carrier protein